MLDKNGGWAWCILGTAFFNELVVSGLAFVAGMFQVLFLEEFKGTVAMTSWITSLFSSLMQLGGPLSSCVANQWSCRVAVMLGGLFLALGFLASGLANGLPFLFVSFGVVAGIGLGLIHTASVVVVSFFFDDHRNLVNGVVFSAGGLGILLAPQISRVLFEQFSWREALFILAGASLHVVVSGALMFPVHERNKNSRKSRFRCLCWSQPRSEKRIEQIVYDFTKASPPESCLGSTRDVQANVSQSCKDSNVDGFPCSDDVETDFNSYDTDNVTANASPYSTQKYNHHYDEIADEKEEEKLYHQSREKERSVVKPISAKSEDCAIFSRFQDQNRVKEIQGTRSDDVKLDQHTNNSKQRTNSANDVDIVSDNSDVIIRRHSYPSSLISLTQKLQVAKADSVEGICRPTHSSKHNCLDVNDVIPAIDMLSTQPGDKVIHVAERKYPSLLKNDLFKVLCLVLFIANAGGGITLIHLASFLHSQGLDDQGVADALSANGLGLLVGRALIGALANSSPGSELLLFMMLHLGGGTILLLMPALCTNYVAAMVMMFGLASYVGTTFALLPGLTVQYVGLAGLTTAFGLEMVVGGAGFLVAPPFGGWLVDMTNNYDYNILFGGSLVILAGLILMVMPRLEKTRETTLPHLSPPDDL